jgi:hypothetical protein
MSDKYNGWTNYETWNINLWLSNDECFVELAKSADTTYNAAGALKVYTEELAKTFVPGIFDGAKSAFVGDLFGRALGSVDWYDIAEHYRDEVD